MSSHPRGKRSLFTVSGRIRFVTIAIAALAITPVVDSSASAASRLRAPALQKPAKNARVASLPTFEWASVRRAASYQFQIAADSRFGSIVSSGSFKTANTAAAVDKAVPDGTYYWRVRAITAKDSSGPWSRSRKLVKAWTTAPKLLGLNGTTITWPSQPLVLRWSAVPYAVRYLVTVATDSRLATQVIGTASTPLMTYGTIYAPSSALTPGTYFWAVTPLDAQNHKGRRSAIGSFTYSWPTTTTPTLDDLFPGAWPGAPLTNQPSLFSDPLFSWSPVPGAARYEVEINSDPGFPPGSKWCCTNTTLGTSMAPLRALSNVETYRWRVRAIDARGNTGDWYGGDRFRKVFDTPASSSQTSISNLQVVDTSGKPVQNSSESPTVTDTPIVRWDPVPGAARYEVQLAPYEGIGCDWSHVTSNAYHAETATTGWTPLGYAGSGRPGPSAWPSAQNAYPVLLPAHYYCLRVLARSDDDARGRQVIGTWTQLNGNGRPAFYYAFPPTAGTPAPGLPMPAGNYMSPAYGSRTVDTPVFTWQRVSGAQGYFVVISHDSAFTDVADVAYTNVPAYAPQLANDEPLPDQTDHYYWVVLPTTGATGDGEYSSWTDDSPQRFDKSSIAPSPLAPGGGTNVSAQPTFRWSGAEGARNYTLQVSADSSFGNLIDNVTTDATAYTSNSTYPADKELYWRVRANDWLGHGLNWSSTRTFVRSLPAPVPSRWNATSGELIPALAWAPVQGATAYDIHVDWVDGTTSNITTASPAFTPVQWTGVGVWRWSVRAAFPTLTGSAATSGYSVPQTFIRLLKPPTGARGVKTGTRLKLWWNPDPAAKQYQVDVSTTDGFSLMVDSHRTDNTSWAPTLDLTKPQTKGRLYWRVAAVDSTGNIGTFATGAFGKNPRVAHKPAKKRSPHR